MEKHSSKKTDSGSDSGSDSDLGSAEVTPEPPLILLVEDNKINQVMVLKMIRQTDAVIHTADDGLLGVEACRKSKFDLILMDLSMPNMDGFDATREILTKCPLNQNTPIIAVSANCGDDVERRCAEVGMSEYVSKPLRLARFRELLKKYLS